VVGLALYVILLRQSERYSTHGLGLGLGLVHMISYDTLQPTMNRSNSEETTWKVFLTAQNRQHFSNNTQAGHLHNDISIIACCPGCHQETRQQ